MFICPTVEDHAPLPDAQPPKTFRAAEALDVAVGKLADCCANALTVLPTQLAEGLQRSGADLDPPSAWISQRSAPPRHPAKECPVRCVPR